MSQQLKQLSQAAKPIIKWAGGKSSLISQFEPYIPTQYDRYFEPFIGGGAMFFYLHPSKSFLMDLNPNLIEVYEVVRDNVEELIEALRPHRNDKEHYYEVRAQDTRQLTPVLRAARFIFLNKTCYNGLYRENRKGEFNVPFGKNKNPAICDEQGLRAASTALKSADLIISDFGRVLDLAKKNDFIYFDPPYVPLSITSNFTGYTKSGFGVEDQKRLAMAYDELNERGCLVMLSNSSAPTIYDLYQKYNVHEISARRAINSKSDGRGAIKELLITNY